MLRLLHRSSLKLKTKRAKPCAVHLHSCSWFSHPGVLVTQLDEHISKLRKTQSAAQEESERWYQKMATIFTPMHSICSRRQVSGIINHSILWLMMHLNELSRGLWNWTGIQARHSHTWRNFLWFQNKLTGTCKKKKFQQGTLCSTYTYGKSWQSWIITLSAT